MSAFPGNLVGRPVRAMLRRDAQAGSLYGTVRSVAVTRKGGLKSAIVQRPGGERVVDGASYCARCRGERVRVRAEEIEAVGWYGKMVPLNEWEARG
jgi:hypothetical protein